MTAGPASGGSTAIGQVTGGAPAAVGSGGAESVPAGTGGAAPPEVTDAGMMVPAGRMDLGKGDGSDVLTIGDSWMNILTNGGGIEGGLDRAGTSYHHEAIAGTTLIGGDIPAQYNRATAGGAKFATAIMTGGGNDIMFTGGCATKEACAMSVQAIVDALDERDHDGGRRHDRRVLRLVQRERRHGAVGEPPRYTAASADDLPSAEGSFATRSPPPISSDPAIASMASTRRVPPAT